MGITLALLFLFAAPDSVQELEQTLKKNAKLPYEQWSREKAIGALGRVGSPASTRLLIAMLEDEFEHQRDNAVSALIQLKRKDPKERAASMQLLVKALARSRSAETRRHIATALGLIGDATVASPLGTALGKESDARTAAAMATALARLGGAVSAIALHKVAESRPVARSCAIRALGSLKGEAEFIRKFESDRDDAVRAALIEALVELKAPDWPTDPLGERTGIALGLALPRMADPVAARRLAATLAQQTSWRIRSAALTGIEARRESALLPLLIDRLDRERGRLRQDAWLALRRLTGKDVPPDSEQWRALDPLEVAAEATEATEAAEPKGDEARTVGYFGLPVVSERIAFVFDVSGSMRDDGKMDLAREHFGRTAKKLGSEQGYDLFVYRYLLKYPPRPKLERAFGKLRTGRAKSASAWLKKQPAKGGGAIYDALVAAMDDPDVDTIYLLSDGVPSYGSVKRDYRVLQEVRRHNRWRRVAIHTILLGTKGTDRKFMRALAIQNGGHAVDAEGRSLR